MHTTHTYTRVGCYGRQSSTGYCTQMIYKYTNAFSTRMEPITVLKKIYILSLQVEKEIRHGAYVILEDGGVMYSEWKPSGRPRLWCAHASGERVFDIAGSSGNILVGTTEHGHTWFQLERSACCTCSHCGDWIRFKYTGRNQGPEGSSCRTESNPIVLNCTCP